MKRLLLPGSMVAAVLLLGPSTSLSQSPQTVARSAPLQQSSRLFAHKSIDQAWKAAVKGKKPLLVMFTSDSCVYCKKMLKETYRHPSIQKLLVGNTESVLAHANQYRDLVKKLGVRGYPTTMLVSPEGKVLDFVPGFVEPKAFAQRIHPLLQKNQAKSEASHSAVAVSFNER